MRVQTSELIFMDMADVEGSPPDTKGWFGLNVDTQEYVFEFPNGYGARVLQGPDTIGGPEGLWELTVLKDWEPCFTTPVTSEVEGNLLTGSVTYGLNQIAALPAAIELEVAA